MTQIEKLEQVGILGEVRQRLGADDENDTAYDERINRMKNSDLIAKWSGWKLGDEGWWKEMKAMFDDLEELDNQNKPTPNQLAEQNKELLEALKEVQKQFNKDGNMTGHLFELCETAIRNAETK